jgi:hypothetical protein
VIGPERSYQQKLIILASFDEGPLSHRALAVYSATGAAG